MRPSALRPPLRRCGSSNDRSGSVLVTSVKSATDIPRRPAEVGLYWRMGMATRLHVLEEIDALTFGQGHVCLLPGGAAADIAPDAAGLAQIVDGPHFVHLHFEQRFDGAADLFLVGLAPHPEDHLVAGLVDHRALLGDE